jgi:hypothetical protein
VTEPTEQTEHFRVYDTDLNSVSCNCGFRPDGDPVQAEQLVATHVVDPTAVMPTFDTP